MPIPILTTELRTEQDVVLTRQRARQIAELLGFEHLDQTRIATAVSEIARNAFRYAGGGRVEFSAGEEDTGFHITVRDTGAGISSLDDILEGRYRSGTGMGIGIAGARRLMDLFEIRSDSRGTEVRMGKTLPRGSASVNRSLIGRISEALARVPTPSAFSELEQQNRELIEALSDVRRALMENERLSQELSETNRGVMALYRELDEKALDLQRASELKSRFLSNMSHEFRTPLNSILSLSQFLLDRLDGPLEPEQEKQVALIRKSARELYELVDDLLDLAKIEAGKISIRPSEFTVAELFSTLRGMFRPLVQSDGVPLVFRDAEAFPRLHTDEGRVAQVLRNFISNALKFTETGQITVWAETAFEEGAGDWLRLSARDTGIGIAPEDQGRIFEEFAQVESPLQRRVRGTGLGLPLSRKLAELLGGRVDLVSQEGAGSTFSLVLPRVLPGLEAPSAPATSHTESVSRAETPPSSPDRPSPTATAPTPAAPDVTRGATTGTALLIDDQEEDRYVLRQLIGTLPCRIRECSSPEEGLAAAREERPDVIFLDLMMPEMTGFEVLKRLKDDPATRDIPVIIVTSKLVDDLDRRKLGRGVAAILTKAPSSPNAGIAALRQALVRAGLSDWLTPRSQPASVSGGGQHG